MAKRFVLAALCNFSTVHLFAGPPLHTWFAQPSIQSVQLERDGHEYFVGEFQIPSSFSVRIPNHAIEPKPDVAAATLEFVLIEPGTTTIENVVFSSTRPFYIMRDETSLLVECVLGDPVVGQYSNYEDFVNAAAQARLPRGAAGEKYQTPIRKYLENPAHPAIPMDLATASARALRLGGLSDLPVSIPTIDEWTLAAAGGMPAIKDAIPQTPEEVSWLSRPSKGYQDLLENIRIASSGKQIGKYGLKNMFGNVDELVLTADARTRFVAFAQSEEKRAHDEGWKLVELRSWASVASGMGGNAATGWDLPNDDNGAWRRFRRLVSAINDIVVINRITVNQRLLETDSWPTGVRFVVHCPNGDFRIQPKAP